MPSELPPQRAFVRLSEDVHAWNIADQLQEVRIGSQALGEITMDHHAWGRFPSGSTDYDNSAGGCREEEKFSEENFRYRVNQAKFPE